MNRYRTGGPSKATPNTLCQKCLKKGHYSYECTATQQQRPYNARPSRTQQLLNPKLAPKLTAAAPEPKVEDRPAPRTLEDSRPRKRSRDDLPTTTGPSKRRRSVSTHSSDSVSTISTNRSRSRSQSRDAKRPTDSRQQYDSPPRRRRSSPRPRRDSHSDASRSPNVSPDRSVRRDERRPSRSESSRSPVRAFDERPTRLPSTSQRPISRPEAMNLSRERSPSPYSKRMAMSSGGVRK